MTLSVIACSVTPPTQVPVVTLSAPSVEAKPDNLPKKTADPISSPPLTRHGTASWYSLAEHGRPTTSGQLYDFYGLTAAHATLPLLSRVKVRHKQTGADIIVTINDRLTTPGILIKLSYQAAQLLGLLNQASPQVVIDSVP